ncbi:MAG TPA: 16S rRNA (cytidine(1402)-2'-O)-methyltransferase [Gaiellaceae bacterium]
MPLAICATPIGNLEDVTLRVLAELRDADLVLAEDTRHTRTLLERHDIRAKLLSYQAHNEEARLREVLPRLESGERITLVSDAGLPGISDPGMRLVRAARDAGVAVTVLPGPSAATTALVASGLDETRFMFVGFLPRRDVERDRLWESLAAWEGAIVAYESPRRLAATLRSLARHDPARTVVVCRELTKRYEEVVHGTAAELAERFAGPVKGEITLVLGSAAPRSDPADALAAVRELVAAGAPRGAAAEVVARLTGTPRNELYRGTL